MNFFQTVEAAKQIIMLNGRGRFLKMDKKAVEGCESDFTEEYKYLTMQYFSKNCQGAIPGGVIISWKY